MFPPFSNIGRADIYNGTTDCFGRRDDNVVIFCDLEGIKRLASSGYVQYTGVDGVWYGVIDEFTEDQTISTFIENLHRSRRNGES